MEIKSKSADTNIADVPRKRRRRGKNIYLITILFYLQTYRKNLKSCKLKKLSVHEMVKNG